MKDWQALFMLFGLVCSVVGWAFIEFLIWFFSNISFNF